MSSRAFYQKSAMSESKPEESVKPVEDVKAEVEELPPLSDHDFKAYNRMAEHMNYFVRSAYCMSYEKH